MTDDETLATTSDSPDEPADLERLGTFEDADTIGTTMPESPATEDATSRTFDRTEQRFEFGDELGRGGMGRVVAAVDVALARDVAIKQALSQNEAHLARFEREVRITARLEHPSIVPIHDVGRDDEGRPYYVMRKIAGHPLSERLAGDVRSRVALIPNVLAACDAAAFAHARRVIHRDIKPPNILLGDYGETLLIDWGIARTLDEVDAPVGATADPAGELTRAGDIYGTPGYMAPEQARGERVDARCDVYALGATLFHVVAGKLPFKASSAGERIALAALGEPPPLDEIDPEVPQELVAIVGKAMAPEAGDRYPDAGALAADLRAFLAGKLVGAHRYTRRERLVRFVRRHRMAVAISTAATIAVVVLGAIAIDQIVDAKNEAIAGMRVAEVAMADARAESETNLLNRASTLSSHDPTRSIALLKNGLRNPSPAGLRRAREIAANAAANGIANGRRASTGNVLALAMSATGELISVGGDGDVAVLGLSPATKRVVANIPTVSAEVLSTESGASITVFSDQAITVLDARTGATRWTIPIRATRAWIGRTPDRIQYHDLARREVVELSVVDKTARVIARDIDIAVGDLGLVIAYSHDGVRLVDGDLVHELAKGTQPYPAIAVSRSLERAAHATPEEVLEFDLAGQLLHRHAVGHVVRLFYGSDALYGIDWQNRLRRFRSSRISDLGSVPTQILEIGRSKGGLVLAFEGVVLIVNELGITKLTVVDGGRQLVASPSSTWIAVGASDGFVRWWDISNLAPTPVVMKQGSICHVDATTIYLIDFGEMQAVERTTSKTRTVARHDRFGPLNCRGPIGGRYITTMSDRALITDIQTGAVRELPNLLSISTDPSRDVIVGLREGAIVEIDGATGRERIVWSHRGVIDQFVANGNWLVVAHDKGDLTRIDRDTGATITIEPGTVDRLMATPTGTVWFSRGQTISSWAGGSLRDIATLNREVDMFLQMDDVVAVQLRDRSIWVFDQKLLNRAVPSLHRKTAYGDRGRVVSYDTGDQLSVRWLGSNDIWTRKVPSNIILLGMFGRRVVTTFLGTPMYVVVHEDPVPDDPAQLRSWLEQATNATLDTKTDALEFP